MCRAGEPPHSAVAVALPAPVVTIGKELGSGAFSTVHEATLGEGKDIAVKIVSLPGLREADLVSLQREISIGLELVSHPAIVGVKDFFVAGEKVLLVQERMLGGDLFHRIKQKTCYTEAEARPLVMHLLQALSYMHGRGIVHRDIKPENILMTSKTDDTSCKIADFGFARRASDPTVAGEAVGTPAYVAPEVLRGAVHDSRADVWSLGVTMYAVLGGYAPFFADNHRDLFQLIAAGRFQFHPRFWGHVSPAAKDFIRCMLVVDRKQRWSADELLAHPWLGHNAAMAAAATATGPAAPPAAAATGPAAPPAAAATGSAAPPATAACSCDAAAAAAAASATPPLPTTAAAAGKGPAQVVASKGGDVATADTELPSKSSAAAAAGTKFAVAALLSRVSRLSQRGRPKEAAARMRAAAKATRLGTAA